MRHFLIKAGIILLVVFLVYKLYSGSEGMTSIFDDTNFHDSPAPVPSSTESSVGDAQLTSADLLPKDNYSDWSKLHPNGDGLTKNQNFLIAGAAYGINTVSGSNKNANYQLRSDYPIPKKDISPWLQSSYPSLNCVRRPMEIDTSCDSKPSSGSLMGHTFQ